MLYAEANVYAIFSIGKRILYYNDNFKKNDNLAPIILFIL